MERREQADGYRVEGEVGRFGFSLYEAVEALLAIYKDLPLQV